MTNINFFGKFSTAALGLALPLAISCGDSAPSTYDGNGSCNYVSGKACLNYGSALTDEIKQGLRSICEAGDEDLGVGTWSDSGCPKANALGICKLPEQPEAPGFEFGFVAYKGAKYGDDEELTADLAKQTCELSIVDGGQGGTWTAN